MAVLMFVSSILAGSILFFRPGVGYHFDGTVSKITKYPEMAFTEYRVRLKGNWPGHETGQFAFLKFANMANMDGTHPFTMSSDWDQKDPEIVFTIKGLGDFTSRLNHKVSMGTSVNIEGPYGQFDFKGDGPQIWVGAGVGVTPFLARLEELARVEHSKLNHTTQIDFYYLTRSLSPDFEKRLSTLAKKSSVNLHLVISERGERFKSETIFENIDHADQASYWVCGPCALGQSIEQAMKQHGIAADRYHKELFEFR